VRKCIEEKRAENITRWKKDSMVITGGKKRAGAFQI
jgi:hypothetical protein